MLEVLGVQIWAGEFVQMAMHDMSIRTASRSVMINWMSTPFKLNDPQITADLTNIQGMKCNTQHSKDVHSLYFHFLTRDNYLTTFITQ